MKLKEFIESQGMTYEEFKKLDKETRKELRAKHEKKNRKENAKATEELKAKYREIEEARRRDTTDEEIYKSMYEHLYEVFGPWLMWHDCSGTLKLTRRYLNKYCKSKEQYNRIIEYIQNHGGFCDCEVLLNCSPTMNKDYYNQKEFSKLNSI